MGFLVLILMHRSAYSVSAFNTYLREVASTQERQVGRKVKGGRPVAGGA